MMKTCMLGAAKRSALVERWPEVVARGVLDEGGSPLAPGDLVSLPAGVRWGSGADWPAPGVVVGYAVDKRGVPSVAVHGPAWGAGGPGRWKTWVVNGEFCRRSAEGEAARLAAPMAGEAGLPDAEARSRLAASWAQVLVRGVVTRGGVAIGPGDLVRLPRNVARNRGSQLHAAGLCLGYAVGMDDSPCVVVDAVGEDVPGLVRWRTWLARGVECLVIDSREAWRLEGKYDRGGRPRKGPR